MSTLNSTIPTGIGTATLAEEGVDFIIRNLSTMYTDPLYAVLREWIANAVDSVTTAYTRGEISSTDNTIHITLPDYTNPTLTVTDYGLGMDRDHVFNYALNYGRSSKRDDDVTAGKFGLGLKSGLAVANQFTITSIRNGKQTMGFLSLGEADAGVENFCSEAQDTDLDNQTTLSVTVADDAPLISIETKIIRVLGGYDPNMFVLNSPSGAYSLTRDNLYDTFRCNKNLSNFADTVYSAPNEITTDDWTIKSHQGNWAITAIIGGVSYPIKEGLVTHNKQINAVINEKLAAHGCAQKLSFSNIIEHSIICPINGVDIPDNRDTLIFSAKTIDTLANAYVAAILDAKDKAADYFDSVTVAQAIYDEKSILYTDTDFAFLHTFAPQWYRDTEIIARSDTVLCDRYGDELLIENGNDGDTIDTLYNLWANTNAHTIISHQFSTYAMMKNNGTKPTPGFDIYRIDNHLMSVPDNIITPAKTLFIQLDVSNRKKDITEEYPGGREYTKQVYIDDKGHAHKTAAQCIEALFKQYRVRINTWRRNNQFPEALIGPNPEIYVWEKSDFSEVISFDDFIKECTAAHRAHLKAQRKENKDDAYTASTDANVIASFGSLYYRGDQHGAYNHRMELDTDITIQQLREFADTHNIAVHDLPIMAVTHGNRSKLKDTIASISFNSPAVAPVVVFLRSTKKNIRKLTDAGFNTIFDKNGFMEHCRNIDTALREDYFASLNDTDRNDIGSLVWMAIHCPLVNYTISSEHVKYNHTRDTRQYDEIMTVIEKQFKDRGIDITTNAGYVFMHNLIASTQHSYELLSEHVPDMGSVYTGLDQDDTTTWQFSGYISDIAEYAQQPVPLDQPMEHAICGMLQSRRDDRYSSIPYIGLLTKQEYERTYKDAWRKYHDEYTPLERVLATRSTAQLYDVLVRIVQLDW